MNQKLTEPVSVILYFIVKVEDETWMSVVSKYTFLITNFPQKGRGQFEDVFHVLFCDNALVFIQNHLIMIGNKNSPLSFMYSSHSDISIIIFV